MFLCYLIRNVNYLALPDLHPPLTEIIIRALVKKSVSICVSLRLIKVCALIDRENNPLKYQNCRKLKNFRMSRCYPAFHRSELLIIKR